MNDASWIDAARPVVDAFLEATFFLASGIQCAKDAQEPAQAAPRNCGAPALLQPALSCQPARVDSQQEVGDHGSAARHTKA
jgi:hypothetical protein